MSVKSELRKLLIALEVSPKGKTVSELLGEVSKALGGQDTGKTVAKQIYNIALAKGFPEDGDFTITYNVNGGTGSIDPVDVKAGDSVDLDNCSDVEAPENKYFAGWAKSNSAQNPTVSSPYTPFDDVTLYAVWKYIVYTISYDPNGGTGSIDPVDVNSGSSTSLSDGTGFVAPEFMEFNGWEDSEGNTVSSPYSPTANITLYAKWANIVYTVTYNANGGTGSVDPEEVNAGSSVELSDGTGLIAPAGKQFAGWATTDSATEPDVTSPYTPVADVTLYAVWENEVTG